VKRGVLLGFRLGVLEESGDSALPFVDKDTYPVRRFTLADRVRVVPGGSSVRRGAHVGVGVTIMPPAYINVGAFVDEGAMVDSHALVGSRDEKLLEALTTGIARNSSLDYWTVEPALSNIVDDILEGASDRVLHLRGAYRSLHVCSGFSL